MAPKLVLTYFGLPGRAEVARLLLTIGKIEFEVRLGCAPAPGLRALGMPPSEASSSVLMPASCRSPRLHHHPLSHVQDQRIAFDQWPAIKPTAPFGQAPMLTADGKPLAQSAAIGG